MTTRTHYVGRVGVDVATSLVRLNPQVAHCGAGVVQIAVCGGEPLTLAGDYVLTGYSLRGCIYQPPALQVGAVAYPLSIEDDTAALYRVWSVIRRAWCGPTHGGYCSALGDAGMFSLADARELVTRLPGEDDPVAVMVPTTITR